MKKSTTSVVGYRYHLLSVTRSSGGSNCSGNFDYVTGIEDCLSYLRRDSVTASSVVAVIVSHLEDV